ncbi:hypothetical protein CASFOL_012255 [Castilleja foliolosa]|uniref:Uncharacterized protein n=1 Tax=Castilleja foliolosa TaxID=1961234 RepID=A0ABD3DPU4_9LAMI
MASLQEEHLNRLRYEAATGGKRPAQPSIPGHVEVEEKPKKRSRMTVRKARAAPPTRRTSVSTSGPLCESLWRLKLGRRKVERGRGRPKLNPPARKSSTSTADIIPENLHRDPQQGDTGSTTSTGFLMLEPPQTQMPESTSVSEVHELDRDDLAITPMTLTEEEMVAPYMRANEMKIFEGVQYIYRETG